MQEMGATQQDLDRLRLGEPPEDAKLLDAITVGKTVWEDFVADHYLGAGAYIADGYSQLKFLLGRSGSGKTHLLRRLARQAEHLRYLSVLLSAKELHLQYVNDIYTAVMSRVNVDELITRLANRVVRELGYDPGEVPKTQAFLEWCVSTKNRIDIRVRRDVEEALGRFFKGERTDPSFSLAIIQLASDILGTHSRTPEDKNTILTWLRGEKLPAAELRRVFIPKPIDRYNAREMFRAFASFARQQGYTGLFIAVDEMEDLLAKRLETGRFKYGRVALTDAYQSMREFIDDLPDIPATLVVFAGRSELLWDEQRGIKSYDALWLRIQHEVVAPIFNPFAQLVDLDKGVRACLSADEAKELCSRLRPLGGKLMDDAEVQEILSVDSGEGVYRRLIQRVLS